MSDSIRHQDAAGEAGSPLGIFHGDRLVTAVAEDQSGYDLRNQLAADMGLNPADLEVLIICHNHPDTAAVDCLTCLPLE